MKTKRLLTSLMVLVVAAGAVAYGTSAFFSDTETSTGNVLHAGSIDLKVDSTAHYNGLVCAPVKVDAAEEFVVLGETQERRLVTHRWQLEDPQVGTPVPWMVGRPCWLTWEETDLGGRHSAFFRFWDVKPGDWGENTISLHVYDNDAWGRVKLDRIMNWEGGCTEPERDVDQTCRNVRPTDLDDGLLLATEPMDEVELETMLRPHGVGLGELQHYLKFWAWLDQGETPGFQGIGKDKGEGDNIWQRQYEPGMMVPRVWGNDGPELEFRPVIARIWNHYCKPEQASEHGHNDYGFCHGLTKDGHMVASTTYYIGLAWELPKETGNIVQTDGVAADLTFDVVQYRHNPDGVFGDEVPAPATLEPVLIPEE
jgi:predicted ribosomally synthesized peptide with SipW-like signal peptide